MRSFASSAAALEAHKTLSKSICQLVDNAFASINSRRRSPSLEVVTQSASPSGTVTVGNQSFVLTLRADLIADALTQIEMKLFGMIESTELVNQCALFPFRSALLRLRAVLLSSVEQGIKGGASCSSPRSVKADRLEQSRGELGGCRHYLHSRHENQSAGDHFFHQSCQSVVRAPQLQRRFRGSFRTRNGMRNPPPQNVGSS
jgi:hypothetical protein